MAWFDFLNPWKKRQWKGTPEPKRDMRLKGDKRAPLDWGAESMGSPKGEPDSSKRGIEHSDQNPFIPVPKKRWFGRKPGRRRPGK
jgi:hypothetical protein